eukprot:Plantae.Rhodophyta-Rhodochaete_pulchella.ctg12334.p1 GENE.Plantae.Rhodophyta-Rhodochaete_pulchella.ctg12334~~Plantae.Rhodophyta-Rhodochaete_pulchella.ctg12334.p1  ORF type:complete len:391 (+),score=62.84 Plantae.Rhodophyta-Rhodochaete_pulchella.ctg12334:149-1321(+)
MAARRAIQTTARAAWRLEALGSPCRRMASTASGLVQREVPMVPPSREFFPVAVGRSTSPSFGPVATLIPGQGIGKEATEAMLEVFDHADVPLEWEKVDLAPDAAELPTELFKSFARTGVAVKGPFFTPPLSKKTSFNILLRTHLDLYANVVHATNFDGINTRHKDVDLVVIRENTEGEYSGLEHEVVPGVVESLKIISKERSMRIARYGFEYALRNNRRKVTAVHKANIMKQSDGLFLQCCREVAAEYPFLEFEAMIVDNTCMQLASKPQQFDVMIMPNLYGNIVTNIAAGLVGGPGLFPGMNVGSAGAIFEQGARHAATAIAGKNIANPTGTVLAAVMLLRHLKLDRQAQMIENAVRGVFGNGGVRTPDVGGRASTTDFVKAIVARLED